MMRSEIKTLIAKIEHGESHDDTPYDTLRDGVTNDERREVVQEVERAIKRIAGEPADGYSFDPLTDDDLQILEKLISLRAFVMNLMVRPTEAEVRRLERQNDILLRRTLDLFQTEQSFSRLSRQVKRMSGEKEVSAQMLYEPGCPNEALPMTEDDYYGSDFRYMLNLQPIVAKEQLFSCAIERISFGLMADDGTTWASGCLHRPEFDHISICHALHNLCSDLPYTIPDVLRMTNFTTEVELEIRKVY